MTAIRQSILFGPELEFGVHDNVYGWVRPPPGSYVDFTHNRTANPIYATGTKTWETVAYGALQGSWNWTFTMDYDYLEPFLFLFEDYSCDAEVDSNSNPTGQYIHHFKKVNYQRIPSFTLRFARINHMTGNLAGADEVVTLSGCVAKNIKFSMSGGASPVQITISGMYAQETMEVGQLSTTDYAHYNGDIVEFACLLVDGKYSATTESLSIGVDNSAEMIYSTCTPFAVNYAEGTTNYSFSTTAYADDPEKWHTRVYTGGRNPEKTVHTPQVKGMEPCELMEIMSFNSEIIKAQDGSADFIATMSGASKTAKFTIEDAIIKSIQWQRGDGAKLMDSISGVSCRLISLDIKNSTPNMEWRRDKFDEEPTDQEISAQNQHPITAVLIKK